MTNPDELQQVAEVILLKALNDQETAKLIQQLIDDPDADRKALFDTAFAMGVASVLSELANGHFQRFGPAVPLSVQSPS